MQSRDHSQEQPVFDAAPLATGASSATVGDASSLNNNTAKGRLIFWEISKIVSHCLNITKDPTLSTAEKSFQWEEGKKAILKLESTLPDSETAVKTFAMKRIMSVYTSCISFALKADRTASAKKNFDRYKFLLEQNLEKIFPHELKARQFHYIYKYLITSYFAWLAGNPTKGMASLKKAELSLIDADNFGTLYGTYLAAYDYYKSKKNHKETIRFLIQAIKVLEIAKKDDKASENYLQQEIKELTASLLDHLGDAILSASKSVEIWLNDFSKKISTLKIDNTNYSNLNFLLPVGTDAKIQLDDKNENTLKKLYDVFLSVGISVRWEDSSASLQPEKRNTHLVLVNFYKITKEELNLAYERFADPHFAIQSIPKNADLATPPSTAISPHDTSTPSIETNPGIKISNKQKRKARREARAQEKVIVTPSASMTTIENVETPPACTQPPTLSVPESNVTITQPEPLPIPSSSARMIPVLTEQTSQASASEKGKEKVITHVTRPVTPAASTSSSKASAHHASVKTDIIQWGNSYPYFRKTIELPRKERITIFNPITSYKPIVYKMRQPFNKGPHEHVCRYVFLNKAFYETINDPNLRKYVIRLCENAAIVSKKNHKREKGFCFERKLLPNGLIGGDAKHNDRLIAIEVASTTVPYTVDGRMKTTTHILYEANALVDHEEMQRQQKKFGTLRLGR